MAATDGGDVRHPEALNLQAYFDGELDSLAAIEVERHIEQCAECRALVEELERARRAASAAAVSGASGAARRVARRWIAKAPARARRGTSAGRVTQRAQPFWLGAWAVRSPRPLRRRSRFVTGGCSASH